METPSSMNSHITQKMLLGKFELKVQTPGRYCLNTFLSQYECLKSAGAGRHATRR